MQFSLEGNLGAYTIRSYAPGCITVALPVREPLAPRDQETLTRSAIIMPRELIRDWAPQSVEALTAPHLEALLALEPELVLLGTGATLRFPRLQVTLALRTAGIGVEVMDTGAACRTYNILVAEGRGVAAALLV